LHAILEVSITKWPAEHDGRLPSDFHSLSNLLAAPKLLICPSDPLHHSAANWATVTTNDCSYELVAPGFRKSETNVVFLRCNIHGFAGYSDGRLLDRSGSLIKTSR
jgi:hypothetical protein